MIKYCLIILFSLIGIYALQSCSTASDSTGKNRFDFDGNGIDWINAIQATDDGNVFMVGYSNSTDLARPNHGELDAIAIYLDANFDTVWTYVGGASGPDAFIDVVKTSQGYLTCGYKTGATTEKDLWLVHFDEKGQIIWDKTIVGENDDQAFGIAAMSDDRFAVTGFSNSSDIPIGQTKAGHDGFIFQLDLNGEVIWSNSYPGGSVDFLMDVIVGADQIIYAAGFSKSTDGIYATNLGGFDACCIAVSSTGELEWAKSCGSSSQEFVTSMGFENETLVLAGSKYDDTPLGEKATEYWGVRRLDLAGNTFPPLHSDDLPGVAYACCTINGKLLIAGRIDTIVQDSARMSPTIASSNLETVDLGDLENINGKILCIEQAINQDLIIGIVEDLSPGNTRICIVKKKFDPTKTIPIL